MRTILLAALALSLAAAAADARGRGFHLARSPHAHRAAHARKAPGEGRHHRASSGEIKSLGPSTFHPVKRYKGFSYLQHEEHPAKDD
jgi:hypothetical protein